MRQMRRVRDGKIAVFDQGCVDSGVWQEVIPDLPKPEKPTRQPAPPKPQKPLVQKTTGDEAVALFSPPESVDTNEG
jgi:hypothetical protein